MKKPSGGWRFGGFSQMFGCLFRTILLALRYLLSFALTLPLVLSASSSGTVKIVELLIFLFIASCGFVLLVDTIIA